MKRIMILLFIVIITLTGCSSNLENNEVDNNENNTKEEIIKDPIINWWKVYNNTNKKNCVVVEVSNPNNFAVQFKYDLVYYKNNEVVRTESNWAMTGLDSNGLGLIYGDIDIPSSADVDNVKLENIETTRFTWTPLKGTFTKSLIDNERQYFDAKFNDKPRYTEIWAVLYNDLNNNKKVEANEFIEMGALAPFIGIYDTTGQIYIPARSSRYDYTDYRIYCFAFKM